MQSRLRYPELTPPAGFRLVKHGSQLWLYPPDEAADAAAVQTAIIVSPLLETQLGLPPPATLIAMTLRAEELGTLHIDERVGPLATETSEGLSGVYFAVAGHVRPSGPPQRRLYVLYADARFYYGINYVAAPERFPVHEATFWRVARSIQKQPAPPPAADAAGGAGEPVDPADPLLGYKD
jgi:hypothetical protein